MGLADNSLFSLELVVEKLYIPHTPCRFPAVAFRLLDFPTIVIRHVEDDLGKAIRQKISFDPSYQLPQQFIELKDKHGNFMIKKGKSCLFTMQPDVLKQHLVSTPLYVMIIDLFPETPKLVGNSTVPLDSVMEMICSDIVKLGPTVPSVHGDKGLFKLYNLMGKEIGYFVLGYRLLSLGPGMIQHLPDSALVHRRSSRRQKLEEKRVDDMMNAKAEEEQSDESIVELRTSACMTDPIKHDVHLQTIELEDKAVHVEFSSKDVAVDVMTPTSPFLPQTKSTQTGKKKKSSGAQKLYPKWVEQDDLRVEDDGPIINNIICPPPLFYNSEATPAIEINRDKVNDYDPWEISSVDDLSELESFDGQGIDHGRQKRKDDQAARDSSVIKQHYLATQNSNQKQNYKVDIPQARHNEIIQGLNVAPRPDTVFPLLTALIQELSCIQNPDLLLNVSQRIQATQAKQFSSQPHVADQKTKEDKISPSAVSAVAAALTKKLDASKDKVIEKDVFKRNDIQQAKADMQRTRVSNLKLFQKDAPSTPKKKKLVYGMTNTQRLRLQKTNPLWLKNVEKEAASVRPDKKTAQKVEREDLNAANLSDTLTEVRRLAEIEMNSTAGGDTIRQIASEAQGKEFTLEIEEKMKTQLKRDVPNSKQSTSSPTSRVHKKTSHRGMRQSHSPPLKKRENQEFKSSSRGSLPRSSLSKSRSRMRSRRAAEKEMANSSDSDELMAIKRPVPLERHIRNIISPHSMEMDEQRMNDGEEGLSARSDLPSSRSRSIEVRLPSADPGNDDNATITDEEYYQEREMDDDDDGNKRIKDDSGEDLEDDDIPLPDDSMSEKPKVQVLNFPRYVSRDMSLPDSIEGVPNASLNVSGAMDENSPLESTRQSRNMTEDQNDSRVLHSTDYDTRQFHSTDEPELQGLVSEEENPSDPVESGRQSVTSVRMSQKFPVINPQISENSPVPSVRRSTTKLDAGHSYLPSMSLSKGHNSPVSSRPSTPKSSPSKKKKEFEPLIPNKEGKRVRGSITPRTGSNSPQRPTPRSKRAPIDLKASIHTDSLSSYVPSDPENVLVTLSSNSGNYSDDFVPLGSGESGDAASSVEQLPKILPSSKLGYTIN